MNAKLRQICLSDQWLPRKDSNLDKVIQSHLCYRYTTRQGGEKLNKLAEVSISFLWGD